MVEYGCNVANKFGFMSDDDEFEDPQELIAKAAKVEAQKAAALKNADKNASKPAPVVKEVAKPAGKENAKPAERGRGARGRGRGGAPRTPREGGASDVADRFGENAGRGRGGGRGRGSRPFRGRGGNTNTSEASKDVSFEEGTQEVSAEGGQGRRGGRGAFTGDRRGGRGGRGRQFDRQSGSDRTGVRGTEKKDGHGKGNWGTEKDEVEAAVEASEEEQPREPEAPREKTEEELAYEAEMAAFAKLKTLKEFKAAQKKDAAGFKTRQADEGNFGKLVPIQKESIEDKQDEIVVIQRESKKKLLDIDIQFSTSRPARGAPRGRGGRGGGGRGGRGGASGRPATGFDVNSSDNFPALGAK